MLKRFSLLFVLMILPLAACRLTGISKEPTATPTPTEAATEVPDLPTETALPYPTATPLPLGSPNNPIILALPPSLAIPEALESGKSLAEGLTALTGYTIALVQPESYRDVVDDLGVGNAHIAWLPPFAYVDAYEKGYGIAGLSTQRFGGDYYGAQFVANVRGNFKSYFDILTDQNTTDAQAALAQFEGMKPCWDDPSSAAGYVIPLGFLNESGVNIQAPAFVLGHTTVIRSVYAEGICDFGATIVDARESPAIQQDLPDVKSRVKVIWRIDPIIPYDVVTYAASVPEDVQAVLTNSLLQIMQTEEGKLVMKDLYVVDGLKPVDDSFFEQFRHYLEASGLDVEALVE